MMRAAMPINLLAECPKIGSSYVRLKRDDGYCKGGFCEIAYRVFDWLAENHTSRARCHTLLLYLQSLPTYSWRRLTRNLAARRCNESDQPRSSLNHDATVKRCLTLRGHAFNECENQKYFLDMVLPREVTC